MVSTHWSTAAIGLIGRCTVLDLIYMFIVQLGNNAGEWTLLYR